MRKNICWNEIFRRRWFLLREMLMLLISCHSLTYSPWWSSIFIFKTNWDIKRFFLKQSLWKFKSKILVPFWILLNSFVIAYLIFNIIFSAAESFWKSVLLNFFLNSVSRRNNLNWTCAGWPCQVGLLLSSLFQQLLQNLLQIVDTARQPTKTKEIVFERRNSFLETN